MRGTYDGRLMFLYNIINFIFELFRIGPGHPIMCTSLSLSESRNIKVFSVFYFQFIDKFS